MYSTSNYSYGRTAATRSSGQTGASNLGSRGVDKDYNSRGSTNLSSTLPPQPKLGRSITDPSQQQQQQASTTFGTSSYSRVGRSGVSNGGSTADKLQKIQSQMSGSSSQARDAGMQIGLNKQQSTGTASIQSSQYQGASAIRANSRPGGSRVNTSVKQEESKAQYGSSTASYLRTGNTHKQSAFGDFTGNVTSFSKPQEDKDLSASYINGSGSTSNYTSSYSKQQYGTQQTENSSYTTKSSSTQQQQTTSSDLTPTMNKSSFFQPVGLRNIGNTCFMNSILQCVLATPYLNDYMLNTYPKEQKYRATTLTDSFMKLLQSCRGASGAVTPSELKSCLSRTTSQFSGFGQQDAQEFMRFLIDRMHDELNRVTSKPKYREMNFDKLSVSEQSQKWQDYYQEKDNSIMTDVFGGQLMNRLQCLSCKHQTLAFDNFMDLSVEIPRKAVRITGSVSLADCLDKFIETERMMNCGYKCSACKQEVSVEKDLTVFRFPKVLVIHLKRFYHSAMRKEKISVTVQFPEKLDMSKWAPHSNHASKQKAVYNLFGISHHSGSLYSGHYIGEVKNLGEGRWYNCNDSNVSRISSPDTTSSSAYVLFYVMQQ